MIIISHRGAWRVPDEKNRKVAFDRSFAAGFGTETDVRDLGGELVISHDMPIGGELTLAGLLDLLRGRDLPLALNIKADGLARALREQMAGRGHTNWFTFDMSVPEMVVQHRLGLPVFTRASEYERQPALYDQAVGVWLDAFVSQWYGPEDVLAFLRDGKRVAVVSAELHQRDPMAQWDTLRPLRDHPGLMLCTDRPEDAAAFFGVTP